MANDETAKALEKQFNLASLRREANKLSGSQWATYQKVKESCEQHRREEKLDFKLNYESRLTQEKQRLIDKAAGKETEYKPTWAKHDNFNPHTLNQQADKNIRLEHQGRLNKIDDVERDSTEKLIQASRMRERSSYTNEQTLNERFDMAAKQTQRNIH